MNLGLTSQIYFWLFKVKNIKYAVQVICGCAPYARKILQCQVHIAYPYVFIYSIVIFIFSHLEYLAKIIAQWSFADIVNMIISQNS